MTPYSSVFCTSLPTSETVTNITSRPLLNTVKHKKSNQKVYVERTFYKVCLSSLPSLVSVLSNVLLTGQTLFGVSFSQIPLNTISIVIGPK